MRKNIFLFYVFLILVCCSEKETPKPYPVIDVINNIGKYQRVYCSDYFSSIKILPLETREKCLLDIRSHPRIVFNDSIILMRGNNNCQLYSFDKTGKFMNEIGKKGQGPSEYVFLGDVFLNTKKSTIFVYDTWKILEYDFQGNFIRSIRSPRPDDKTLTNLSLVGENMFISQAYYDGKNRFKYCLFDENGDTVKTFPNHIFFERTGSITSTHDAALYPLRIDNQLYLKDYINDTVYSLTNMNLQPAYIFGFDKYSFSEKKSKISNPEITPPRNNFRMIDFVGFPNHFFYLIRIPESFPHPEAKPTYSHRFKQFSPTGSGVYGIYNIEQGSNILLDTDQHLQKGMINDLNGGLPFIPRYYAGNNMVLDVWNVCDMKEILTKEYFAMQTIKDQQAHQELKNLLENIEDEDNPIVIIAILK